MNFNPKRRCEVYALDGSLIWRDPRTEECELLAEAIHSRAKLDEQRIAIGSQAFEAQYNQDPSSDENSVCPPSKWRFYRQPGAPSIRRPQGCDESPAVEKPSSFDSYVIGADLTFGSTKGDYAVVQVWGACESGRYQLEHFRKQCGFDDQVAAIKRFCSMYPDAKVVVEKAANGAAVIETLKKTVRNSVEPMIPVGNKAQRLAGVIGVIDNAQCFLPDGANYIGDMIDEFKTFPGRHDDIVDCAVWCLLWLQGPAIDHAARAHEHTSAMLDVLSGMPGAHEIMSSELYRFLAPSKAAKPTPKREPVTYETHPEAFWPPETPKDSK